MALQRPKVRDERIVVMFDKTTAERVNELANRRFEGNRSLLVRVAVRDLIERQEQEDREFSTEAQAAA